ncbi:MULTISPECIES: flagellar biosynthetic protein FliO [Alishewanella]|uniref:flagellar biosynthetic protein FliO n=1 Tax=Alishewanella TaxID=111142 RepID=UPI0006880175|nr:MULTISPECIES: flagellar biosynthetic protein FliO [Alishewanella]OCW98168.1 flagellar biosynthetic protein FliO [Alishewanella sp. HH-ZS]
MANTDCRSLNKGVLLAVLLSASAVQAISPETGNPTAVAQAVAEQTETAEPAKDEQSSAPAPATASKTATPATGPNQFTERSAVLNPGSEQRSSPMTILQIASSLTLVILLVLGLGWLFKKLTLRLPGGRHIKVVTAMPLGQRERLLVIEIQGKQRVIGVTPHSVNFLFELENPLPEEKLASDFHTQLQSFLKK